ncbi:MAG: hypothetical protein R2758_02770 [Bacteroidales bacterium]
MRAITQTDIGAEIGLLANRFTGEFDFYNRVTNDILVERQRLWPALA